MSLEDNITLNEKGLEIFEKWEDNFLKEVKHGHHNDNQDLTMAFLKLGYLIENLTYNLAELAPRENVDTFKEPIRVKAKKKETKDAE